MPEEVCGRLEVEDDRLLDGVEAVGGAAVAVQRIVGDGLTGEPVDAVVVPGNTPAAQLGCARAQPCRSALIEVGRGRAGRHRRHPTASHPQPQLDVAGAVAS